MLLVFLTLFLCSSIRTELFLAEGQIRSLLKLSRRTLTFVLVASFVTLT